MGNLGRVVAKKGDCIVFPAFMTHKIHPVTKGQRNVIVGWLHGDSFK
jgi:PKHD-type hydroxylase